MAEFTLPGGKRRRQPQQAAKVDWSNHLLKNVDFVMLGSQKFYNPTNKAITRVGNSAPIVTPVGIGIPVNDAEYFSYPNRDATGGTSQWTIAGIFVAQAIPTVGAISGRWSIAGLAETPNSATHDRALIMLDAGDTWGGYLYDGAEKVLAGTAVVAGKPEAIVVTSSTTLLTLTIGDGFESSLATANNGFNGYASAELCVGNACSATSTPTVNIPLFVRTFSAWDKIQRRSFTTNPWQIFEPETVNLYLASASGVSAALTGQGIALTQGSTSAAINAPLSGQSIPLSTGNVAPGLSHSITGQAASIALGSVSPSVNAALSGQGLPLSQGTVTVAVSGASAALTGQGVTVATGAITGNIQYGIVGQSLTRSIGGISAAVAPALSGQALTAATGNIGVGGDITRALSGQNLMVAVGAFGIAGLAVREEISYAPQKKKPRAPNFAPRKIAEEEVSEAEKPEISKPKPKKPNINRLRVVNDLQSGFVGILAESDDLIFAQKRMKFDIEQKEIRRLFMYNVLARAALLAA